MKSIEDIKRAGLKITPQRRAVYEAMMALRHATIEEVIRYILEHPHWRLSLQTHKLIGIQ